jgi:sugar lactone lactonase YvrE
MRLAPPLVLVCVGLAVGCSAKAGAGFTDPLAIAGDASNVVVAENRDNQGRILRVSPDGSFSVLLTENLDPVGAFIAVDSDSVYYSFYTATATPTPNGIRKALLAGGGSIQIAAGSINGLAIDDADVYWLTYDGLSAGSVWKASKAGGSPVMLAALTTERPTLLALNAADVFFATLAETSDGYGLGSAIYRLPKTGGAPAALAVPKGIQPSSLQATDDAVYWLDIGSSGPPYDYTPCAVCRPALVKLPLAGGAPVVLADMLDPPVALALDATNAYALLDLEEGAEDVTSNGSVVRVALAGGAQTSLSSGLAFPKGLVVQPDAALVLYGGTDAEQIARVTK